MAFCKVILFAGLATLIQPLPGHAMQMYWSDFKAGQYGRVLMSNLDGSSAVEVFFEPNAHVKGVAVDQVAGLLYFIVENTNAVHSIRRTSLNGGSVQTLLTGLPRPVSIALDVTAGKMYWTNDLPGQICRANLDGTNHEILVSESGGPIDIALNIRDGTMYWTKQSAELRRANLDGSAPTTIVSGAGSVVGVALDLVSNHLYISDGGATRVRRANLDGSNLTILFTITPGGSGGGPGILRLDVPANKMYWTSISPDAPLPRISRANLDGSNIENLFVGNAFRPDGIALDVPSGAQSVLPATLPDSNAKNRYISFAPPSQKTAMAMQVVKTSPVAGACWVQPPATSGVSQYTAKCGSTPVFRIWNEPVVHVGDCAIIPVADYELRATEDALTFSTPHYVSTIPVPSLNAKLWGDVVGVNNGTEWTPPNQFTNVSDILALQAFISGAPIKPTFAAANLQAVSAIDPCLNSFVNTADVLILVKAVAGNSYPFTQNPSSCPPCP